MYKCRNIGNFKTNPPEVFEENEYVLVLENKIYIEERALQYNFINIVINKDNRVLKIIKNKGE